jgi:hypothetical protein
MMTYRASPSEHQSRPLAFRQRKEDDRRASGAPARSAALELHVAFESRRRRMLAVDDLSDEAMRELEAIGAAVVEDFEYAMETTARR